MATRKIRVRTLWHGQAAIRDRQIEKVIREGRDLIVIHDGKEMFIPFSKIRSSIAAKSSERFYDKYLGEWHHLVYYDWKPDESKQESLFG